MRFNNTFLNIENIKNDIRIKTKIVEIDEYFKNFTHLIKNYVKIYYSEYCPILDKYIEKFGIIDIYDRFLIFIKENIDKNFDISRYTILNKRYTDNLDIELLQIKGNSKNLERLYLFIRYYLIPYLKLINNSIHAPGLGAHQEEIIINFNRSS